MDAAQVFLVLCPHHALQKVVHYQLTEQGRLAVQKKKTLQQYSGCGGSGPVTMLTSLLLEEHSQVRWLAVSSVYRGASLAWRLTALKCHISTVMN